jgi:endonuclease/exonuclease/phosphatase family metal-dependent hydrolase
VLGDFNAEPDSETIAAMKRELCDANSSNTPTWSVYPEGCPVCLPDTVYTTLDYIFTSNDLTASAVHVDRSEASDHLPVVATITF